MTNKKTIELTQAQADRIEELKKQYALRLYSIIGQKATADAGQNSDWICTENEVLNEVPLNDFISLFYGAGYEIAYDGEVAFLNKVKEAMDNLNKGERNTQKLVDYIHQLSKAESEFQLWKQYGLKIGDEIHSCVQIAPNKYLLSTITGVPAPFLHSVETDLGEIHLSNVHPKFKKNK